MTEMPRFREPDASDEKVLCEGFKRKVHYEQCFEDTNFCKECAACLCDEDVKAVNE